MGLNVACSADQLPDVLPSLKSDEERGRRPVVVKTEPGTTRSRAPEPAASVPVSEADAAAEAAKDRLRQGTLAGLPDGRLGVLRVHQSGKVTMQLGDHTFIVDSGTRVSYVQVGGGARDPSQPFGRSESCQRSKSGKRSRGGTQ